MRKRLTDDLLSRLKPRTKRYLVYDSVVSGLAVRVSPAGTKTLVIVGRHGGKHSTRKSLGAGITVDEARTKAQSCHKDGRGPTNKPTFGEIADRFLAHIHKQKRAKDVRLIVNREFVSRWSSRPIDAVTRKDVLEVIDAAMVRGHMYAAHAAWAHIRRLYNWAIARGLVECSPCDRVRPKDIIGEKLPRHRVLTDDELRRVWKATGTLGYPFGPFYRLLLVTGQRRNELAHAKRSEFSLKERVWRLPASRMKAGAPHEVPLTDLAMSIIHELPQVGDYLFRAKRNTTHISGFSRAKRRLDAIVGDMPPFVIHDLRRTVRTRLSQLRVRHEVAEMVIGHGKKGLARVYDQHEYRDEIREALDLWAVELACIVARTR